MSQFYYNCSFENLTGISTGPGSVGIVFSQNPVHPTSWLINSVGINNSNALDDVNGFTSYGIYSVYGNLENCTGKSVLGNGIYGLRSIHKNCVGIAPGAAIGGRNSFQSFVLDTAGSLINCSSSVGPGQSYPLYITQSEDPSTGWRGEMNISNCNFNSNNNNSIFLDYMTYPSLITIQNSVIGCTSTVGYSPLRFGGQYTSNFHISNCQFYGGDAIEVGPTSTIDNCFIKIGSTTKFAISSTPGATYSYPVSYTNNTIKGATTTNGGVTGISQYVVTNISNQGNINYNTGM